MTWFRNPPPPTVDFSSQFPANTMQLEVTTIWNNCLTYIKANIDPKPFRTWFEPLQAVKLDNGVLTLLVPSPVYYEYIEEHFITVLGAALRQELGAKINLEYQVPKIQSVRREKPPLDESVKHNLPPNLQHNNNGNNNIVPPDIKNPFIIPGIRKNKIDPQLNPNLRFDNFVEGECNRIARSAGLAIAKRPGETGFNPLIIYGTTGVGKTHLVHAIGNAIVEQHPDKNVLYVTIHVFMNQLVDHIKNNTVSDFINFYNSLDVLIVDDIQFLDKKQRMQEIFFTVFNHLHTNRKQIIFTTDKAPKDLEGIEDRLISRFRWGLIADVGEPDIETRMAIMMNAMERENIAASIDVLEYLCHHISEIRGVIGCVTRMKALTTFGQNEIDMKMAKEVVQHYVKIEVKTEVTIDGIMQIIADHFKTTLELLKGKTRKREVVEARQLAMYLAKKLIPAKSLMAIGDVFGGRDHATVIYSCKTIENLIDTDPAFRKTVGDVEKRVKLSVG
jgi:chromosomal replication initiator protein